MWLFLVVLLISLDGAAVLAKINCASGTLYKEGEARDDAAMVESIGVCSFSISSKTIPCNITTAEITVDVVSSKPRPICNISTSEINCYCAEDLCNKNPETIYKLLSNTDWSGDTDGEALAHCGLEVIKEKYGYPRTITETISTTRAATAFSTTTTATPDDPDPDPPSPSKEQPHSDGSNSVGADDSKRPEECSYDGTVESSTLDAVAGVLGTLISLLLLVISWFIWRFYRIRKRIKELDIQLLYMYQRQDKIRNELYTRRDAFTKRIKAAMQDSSSSAATMSRNKK